MSSKIGDNSGSQFPVELPPVQQQDSTIKTNTGVVISDTQIQDSIDGGDPVTSQQLAIRNHKEGVLLGKAMPDAPQLPEADKDVDISNPDQTTQQWTTVTDSFAIAQDIQTQAQVDADGATVDQTAEDQLAASLSGMGDLSNNVNSISTDGSAVSQDLSGTGSTIADDLPGIVNQSNTTPTDGSAPTTPSTPTGPSVGDIINNYVSQLPPEVTDGFTAAGTTITQVAADILSYFTIGGGNKTTSTSTDPTAPVDAAVTPYVRDGGGAPPKLPDSLVNLMLRPGGAVLINEAFMLIAKVLSEITKQDAKMMLLQTKDRKATLEANMKAIKDEGQVRHDEYYAIGTIKVVTAGVSLAGAGLTAYKGVKTDNTNAASRASFNQFKGSMDMATRATDSIGGATEQFVHGNFATKVADAEAQKALTQQMLRQSDDACGKMSSNISGSRELLNSILQSLTQMNEKMKRQGNISIRG